MKLTAILVLTTAFALMPLKVEVSEDGAAIAVNEACAQAGACTTAPFYICSFIDGDLVNWKCTMGCDDV